MAFAVKKKNNYYFLKSDEKYFEKYLEIRNKCIIFVSRNKKQKKNKKIWIF